MEVIANDVFAQCMIEIAFARATIHATFTFNDCKIITRISTSDSSPLLHNTVIGFSCLPSFILACLLRIMLLSLAAMPDTQTFCRDSCRQRVRVAKDRNRRRSRKQ